MKSGKPKSTYVSASIFWLPVFAFLFVACERLEPERVIRLQTGPVTTLRPTSVDIVGIVGDGGGQEVISRGICYNSQPNPTLSDSYTVEGSGIGEFTSHISGLVPEVSYYARAYASNSTVTVYGNEISFTTKDYLLWQKSLGGSHDDRAYSITLLTDGNYVISGTTESSDGDIIEGHGSTDIWIVKLTASGDKIWQSTFGGSDIDESFSICATADGGFITAGATFSDDGDITNHGGEDIWILKFSSTGDLDWQKTYGGSEWDWSRCIRQTSDGGYIVAATSQSADGNVAVNRGESDYFILKLNASGDIVWRKSYGGTAYDDCFAVRQTADGGYIAAGTAGSVDFDVPTGYVGLNFWILRLNSSGDTIWTHIYGGNSHEFLNDIEQTADGGFIVAGNTLSSDGQVTGYHGLYDAWILKLNPNGEVEWQRALGGSGNDDARAILQTDDGGYVVACQSEYANGDVTVNHGLTDFWVVRLNEGGGVIWEKSFGGSMDDSPYSIIKSAEGEYVVAGLSNSNNVDVSGNHGGHDYWVLKLDLGE